MLESLISPDQFAEIKAGNVITIPIPVNGAVRGFYIENLSPYAFRLYDGNGVPITTLMGYTIGKGGFAQTGNTIYLKNNPNLPPITPPSQAGQVEEVNVELTQHAQPATITSLPFITGTVSLSTTANLNAKTITSQDASGTVTTAGTSQLVLSANSSRQYLFIENVAASSSSDVLWVNFGSAATEGHGSIELGPGQALDYSSIITPGDAVYVTSNTAGCPFTCKWA